MSDDLAAAIQASASRLGISPRDLATTISYETGGTFDPWQAGPTTQWGQHRGLIQWGEPQRQKYGVYQGMPNADQMRAVERYLVDAGVKPGMGLMDVYSAVNAGRVGRPNASDANNGGAPGTVADKVNYQMGPHMQKADALLGGQMQPSVASSFGPVQQPAAAPAASADPTPGLVAQAFDQINADQKLRQKETDAHQARRRVMFGDVGSAFA